jgi:hypothetical protein
MKDHQLPPEDARLDALLRAARPTPELPPRFQQQVWRRIEKSAAPDPTESWLDTLANLLLRPRWALTGAAVLLLAGALTGTLEGRQMARHNAQMNYLAAVAPMAAR